MRNNRKGIFFKQVKAAAPRYSKFDLSYRNTLSMKYGAATVTLCKKVVLGDRFDIRSSTVVKSLPMLAPTMTEVDLYIDNFFVPLRLAVGDQNFEMYLNGEATLPAFQCSTLDAAGFTNLGNPDKIMHYCGFPLVDHELTTAEVNSLKSLPPISKVPAICYAILFNEYYRDEFVDTPIDIEQMRIQSINAFQNVNLFQARYPKDYFTSMLPFAQFGDAITIPIASIAPVQYVKSPAGITTQLLANTGGVAPAGDLTTNGSGQIVSGTTPLDVDNSASLQVDLSQATATTISQLRMAYRLQEFQERTARGGGRPNEILFNNFGIQIPDYRIQRPEYIGGTRTPISINSIQQTSQSTEDSPQGTQTANAIGVARAKTRGRYFFVPEPGYIIQISYILARQAYFQGIDRDLFVIDYLDEFWPSFENVGEQEVKLQELWTPTNNLSSSLSGTINLQETVGYQSRFSEYKYYKDELHGYMVSDLNHWQSSRAFGSRPALNSAFLQSSPADMDHNFPVASGNDSSAHKWVIAFNHSIEAIRPMDTYGTPMI